MKYPPMNRRAAGVFFLAVVGSAALSASPKVDLTRVKPVDAGETIPVADFFRPPLLENPRLNPSGTNIAALISNGDDKYQLLNYDVATMKVEAVRGLGDRDIYEFTWLDDKRLLFSLSEEKLYGVGLFAVEVGDFGHAYPILQYCGSRLVSVPKKNRLRPLIWASFDALDNGRDLGVVEVDTEVRNSPIVNLRAADLDAKMIEDVNRANDRHIRARNDMPRGGLGAGYITDRDGQLEYAFTADNGTLAMHRLVDGHWTKAPVDLEEIDIIASGNSPGELFALGPRQEGKPRALQLLDGSTGKLGEVVLQDNAYDFDGWIYRDRVSRNVVGAIYERNGPSIVWFTEEYKALQKVLDGFFPNLVVRILGSDEKGGTFLVMTYSDRQPAIYYMVNLEKHSVGLVKNSEPWIDPKRMQPMNIVKIKTRDGHHLDAYLTMPAGASKKNPPPLIVLSHGGPWVRDTWGYNGEVQYFASRGYAVLQTNYRGSPGYDWMFPVEDQWAFRKMSDDVTDATNMLVKSGLVDGKRVAIMGGSFGGYLAVSGVVNEPELYRCAVTIAGVFDWGNFIKNKKYDQYTDASYGRLMRKLGDPNRAKEKFDEISPLRHIDRIRVPVFVAHGTEDHVVDVAESRRLVGELDRHKVAHEDLFVRGEGHGMHHVAHQVELYERITAFLEKNLGPNSLPPASVAAK